MDLDQLLESMEKNGGLDLGETDAVSDAKGQPEEKPAEPQAPGGDDDVHDQTTENAPGENEEKKPQSDDGDGVEEKGVASASDNGEDSEPPQKNERKAFEERHYRKKPVSQLEKAEFAAVKWKRRAKEAQAAKAELEAEFNKYKRLNPRAFDNDEDRINFLTWKSSMAQRIKDMDEDIDAMNAEYERERYEAKIADCYNEQGAADYEALDEHYGDAFYDLCNEKDPDNVILDFLSGSKYEPAMRDVIYKNGQLQEELFRDFRNPAIAATERLGILKSLEAQVKDFFARSYAQRNGAARKAPAPAAVDARRPAETSQAAARTEKPEAKTQPSETQKPTRRFILPSRAVPQSGGTAPTNANAAPKNRQVTGSLTRGGDANGPVDPSAQADALYRELLGSGI